MFLFRRKIKIIYNTKIYNMSLFEHFKLDNEHNKEDVNLQAETMRTSVGVRDCEGLTIEIDSKVFGLLKNDFSMFKRNCKKVIKGTETNIQLSFNNDYSYGLIMYARNCKLKDKQGKTANGLLLYIPCEYSTFSNENEYSFYFTKKEFDILVKKGNKILY